MNNTIYTIIGIGIIVVLIYWFRSYLKLMNLTMILVSLGSISGGILSGYVVLKIVTIFGLGGSAVYTSLYGPILEELVKFAIAYLIIIISQRWVRNAYRGLGIGIMVGMGFGIFENYIYVMGGVTDIKILLYRSLLVGGMILHPLTTGIAGFMSKLSLNSNQLLPGVFVQSKSLFQGFLGIFGLISHIWNEVKLGKNPIKVLFNFFKGLLILDVTVKYLLGQENVSRSGYGHSPSEVLYEGLLLAIWIHVLYNALLSNLGTPNLYVAIIGWAMVLVLLPLWSKLYASMTFGIFIALMIALAFSPVHMAGNIVIISLIVLLTQLFFIGFKINKKLQLNATS